MSSIADQHTSGLAPAQKTLLRAQLDGIAADLDERVVRSEALFRALSNDPTVDASQRQAARADADTAAATASRVRAALDAFDAGTYGACRSCGRSIPFERLEVLPFTTTCVACPGD